MTHKRANLAAGSGEAAQQQCSGPNTPGHSQTSHGTQALPTEQYETLIAEARASGIYALLVPPDTPEWELIDSMTMQERQSCLDCDCRPDVPRAFVAIHARNASVSLYIPICNRCWRKSAHKLQARAQKIIEDLVPGVAIKFGVAQLLTR